MKTPYLSLMGPTIDPLVAIDKILASYLRTSNVGLGVLVTRRSFIDDATDRDEAVDNIENSLNFILNKYFDTFDVTVEMEATGGSNRAITISVALTDNGSVIRVGRIANLDSSSLVNILTVDGDEL